MVFSSFKNSDVFLFSVRNGYICKDCCLKGGKGAKTFLHTPEAALDHLIQHYRNGDRVRDFSIALLEREVNNWLLKYMAEE